MKIVLAAPLYPPEIGPGATYIQELAERLCKAHNVTIVTYASTYIEIPNTTLYTVSKRQPLPLRLFKYTYTLFFATKKAELIYVQNAVAAGLPTIVVGWLRRIPVVLRFGGDEAWERATQLHLTTKGLTDFLKHPVGSFHIHALLFIQGVVLRHATKVIAPSSHIRELLIEAYGVSKDRIIVNYDAAEKTEILRIPVIPVPHQIVTTSRLVAWKGIAGVIRAVALLIKEFPDISLLIAGDGPEEENLKTLTETLHLTGHIRFLGRVSHAETWHIRKTSELYVLNSTDEGLPHILLTSFAAHIPVIATDIPGTCEVVENGISGVLVVPENDADLAEAIRHLFTNPSLRSTVVQGGEAQLQKKFSWDAHLQTLVSIFAAIIAT